MKFIIEEYQFSPKSYPFVFEDNDNIFGLGSVHIHGEYIIEEEEVVSFDNLTIKINHAIASRISESKKEYFPSLLKLLHRLAQTWINVHSEVLIRCINNESLGDKNEVNS